MKAILIDPSNKTVSEISLSGDWKDIAKHLGCEYITVAFYIHADDKHAPDVCYVDDEGLLINPNPNGYFRMPGLGYPGTLAGKGLIVGSTYAGEEAPAFHNADTVAGAVEFIDSPDPDSIEPTITVTAF